MLWPGPWLSIGKWAVTNGAKTISLVRMVNSRKVDLKFGTLYTKILLKYCSNGVCFFAIAFIVAKWQACNIEQRLFSQTVFSKLLTRWSI